jgi:hypothetical protein
MAHLMLVQDMRESVRADALAAAAQGRLPADLGAALANLDALINAPDSLIPRHAPPGLDPQAALRAALGLSPRAGD